MSNNPNAGVYDTLRSTTVATLTTVTAAAHSVTHLAQSAAALAEAASIHAHAYRDDTMRDVEANAVERQTNRIEETRERLAASMSARQERLAKDPKLKAIYDRLDPKHFQAKTATVVAAE